MTATITRILHYVRSKDTLRRGKKDAYYNQVMLMVCDQCAKALEANKPGMFHMCNVHMLAPKPGEREFQRAYCQCPCS